MKPTRRAFLKSFGTLGAGVAAGVGGSVGTNMPAEAQTASFQPMDLRGSVDARQSGLRPGAVDDQSRLFQAIVNAAAAEDKPVFLPPGNYNVSNITLPSRTRITGVAGASKLVYTGNGHFLLSEDAQHLELRDIVIDGANRPIADYSPAALHISRAKHSVIDNCQVIGCTKTAIQFERSAGRIERNRISGVLGECAIYAVESTGLSIIGNTVEDCLNGGILVHRWAEGPDGTIVSGNRVRRIQSGNGGTGQWGNGINVFRAHNVIISNNHVSECALSAIRSNSGSNVQITSNTCLNSGETAIYSEFAFQGAVISNNIVDGGARGISIANFLDGGRMAVCAGNLVRNIHDNAPYADEDHLFGEGISAEAETAITGNVIEKTARFGMMLGWGPYLRNVIASNNIIRDTRTGIYVSVVDGIGPAQITQNVFSGLKDSAIVGHEWKKPVTDDLLTGTRSPDVLTIAGNIAS